MKRMMLGILVILAVAPSMFAADGGGGAGGGAAPVAIAPEELKAAQDAKTAAEETVRKLEEEKKDLAQKLSDEQKASAETLQKERDARTAVESERNTAQASARDNGAERDQLRVSLGIKTEEFTKLEGSLKIEKGVVANLTNEKASINQRAHTLQTELDALKANGRQVDTKKISELEKEKSDLNARNDTLSGELAVAKRTVQSTERALQEKLSELQTYHEKADKAEKAEKAKKQNADANTKKSIFRMPETRGEAAGATVGVGALMAVAWVLWAYRDSIVNGVSNGAHGAAKRGYRLYRRVSYSDADILDGLASDQVTIKGLLKQQEDLKKDAEDARVSFNTCNKNDAGLMPQDITSTEQMQRMLKQRGCTSCAAERATLAKLLERSDKVVKDLAALEENSADLRGVQASRAAKAQAAAAPAPTSEDAAAPAAPAREALSKAATTSSASAA